MKTTTAEESSAIERCRDPFDRGFCSGRYDAFHAIVKHLTGRDAGTLKREELEALVTNDKPEAFVSMVLAMPAAITLLRDLATVFANADGPLDAMLTNENNALAGIDDRLGKLLEAHGLEG